MPDSSDGWTGSHVHPVALPAPLLRVYDRFLAERFPKAGANLPENVARLSESFTAERTELPGSYLNHPPSRSAYLAFFHPLQVLRGMAAIEETLTRAAARGLWPPRSPTLRILDLGAGLGAMTHAFLAVAERAGGLPAQVEVTFVDHQKSAVADARELLLLVAAALRPAAPPPKVRTADARLVEWLARAASAGWRYDVVLLGAVLNELKSPETWLARAFAPLDPGALGGGLAIVVEPAIPQAVRDLMAAREAIAGVTTTIAPCTHSGTCPLLALKRDWCFTTQPARFPPFVVEMSRRLHHQTAEVRFAFWAAAGRADAAPPEHPVHVHARVVSDPVLGGQVLCVDGERDRLPERSRIVFPRGMLLRR